MSSQSSRPPLRRRGARPAVAEYYERPSQRCHAPVPRGSIVAKGSRNHRLLRSHKAVVAERKHEKRLTPIRQPAGAVLKRPSRGRPVSTDRGFRINAPPLGHIQPLIGLRGMPREAICTGKKNGQHQPFQQKIALPRRPHLAREYFRCFSGGNCAPSTNSLAEGPQFPPEKAPPLPMNWSGERNSHREKHSLGQ